MNQNIWTTLLASRYLPNVVNRTIEDAGSVWSYVGVLLLQEDT
jgi:hypothetical protein